MKKYSNKYHGADSVHLANKYDVMVKISVVADSADDAWEYVRDIVSEMVSQKEEEEASEKVYDYDIIGSELSELDI